jgi:hypothetical protein
MMTPTVYTDHINISTTSRRRINLTWHVEGTGNRKIHKPVGSEEIKVAGNLEVLEADAVIILGQKRGSSGNGIKLPRNGVGWGAFMNTVINLLVP